MMNKKNKNNIKKSSKEKDNVFYNLPKDENIEVLETDFSKVEVDNNKEGDIQIEKDILEANKEEKKKRGIVNRILKIISWIVMVVLALIGALLITYIIINKTSQAKGQTPPLGLYTIISPSMTPNIDVYDVVFVVETKPEDIQIGDVISYYSSKDYFNNIPITHRVIEKYNTAQGVIFRTQGDANPIPDDEFVMSGSVVGVVKTVIPQLGRVQFFLSSKGGWIVAILIPAVGVLIYDFIKLIRLIKARREMISVRKAINE